MSKMIQRLEELQEERKRKFLASDRTPWSKEEWRWHREQKAQAVRLRSSFEGTALEFLASLYELREADNAKNA